MHTGAVLYLYVIGGTNFLFIIMNEWNIFCEVYFHVYDLPHKIRENKNHKNFYL